MMKKTKTAIAVLFALLLSGCALLQGVDVAALALKAGCKAVSFFTRGVPETDANAENFN
jgi:hypothetical protein